MNNMNNGVMFNTEGPIMTGSWYNPNTGDSFVVRDSFFENNQFMVSTTDGRLLNYDQLQYYIQSDKPIESMQKNNHDDIPKEIISMLETSDSSDSPTILPDDQSLINGNFYYNATSNSVISAPHPSDNVHIIEKALSKTVLPEINIQLNWSKYPEREIEMLTDIMDVQMAEIVDWYINKFGVTEIKKLMENSIKSYFNINDNTEEVTTTTESVVKKTKSKKK